ncbi:uncharacterized protein LOC118319260 isoform X2 [Scophthalmus maximus]|nr:uncharacterized protein LOC118319260 isoform X2 [Scophthalmus maximus]
MLLLFLTVSGVLIGECHLFVQSDSGLTPKNVSFAVKQSRGESRLRPASRALQAVMQTVSPGIAVLQQLLRKRSNASADIEHESLCYGSTFNLPVRFTPSDFRGQLYFTPSMGGSRKLLINDGEAKDPRLNISLGSVRLTDLTERDNGTFSISFGDESTNDIITLTIDDCAEKITKYYGDIYGSTLPKGTEFVEFTTLHLRDQPQVVWNGTNLQENGKIRMFFSYLEIFRVTQADNGYYNFRKKDNTLLSRILLIVQENNRRSEVWVKERLSIQYPMFDVKWTVTFTPKGKMETQTWIEGNRLVTGDLSGRIWLVHNGIDIDVESTDSGTLEFRDRQGNLALTVEVNVIAEETDPTFIYVAPALVIIFVVVVGCCCVKKFCFKKRSSSNEPAPQTAAAPAVYYHFQDTNPSYSAAPTTSALLSQPMTPPVSSEHSNGPSVAAPTLSVGSEPQSSDPEPTFELKGVTFPAAPLLSSDSTLCDTYTSDKLDFL